MPSSRLRKATLSRSDVRAVCSRSATAARPPSDPCPRAFPLPGRFPPIGRSPPVLERCHPPGSPVPVSSRGRRPGVAQPHHPVGEGESLRSRRPGSGPAVDREVAAPRGRDRDHPVRRLIGPALGTGEQGAGPVGRDQGQSAPGGAVVDEAAVGDVEEQASSSTAGCILARTAGSGPASCSARRRPRPEATIPGIAGSSSRPRRFNGRTPSAPRGGPSCPRRRPQYATVKRARRCAGRSISSTSARAKSAPPMNELPWSSVSSRSSPVR